MIFGKELIPKVLDGSKTVTRRPVKYVANQFLEAVVEKPCKYEVGKDYAIQPGRGKKAVGRIRILDVQREELGARPLGCGPMNGSEWTKAEARREGFKTWEDVAEYWRALYGSYDPTQLVDRIEFEALEDSR